MNTFRYVALIASAATVCVCLAAPEPVITPRSFIPPDRPNSPMGEAKGIFPGRVVWVHDANATNWDPAWNTRKDVFYWDENHTNQAVVEKMMSKGLCRLTGKTTDSEVWNALFRHYNRTHNRADRGYTAGEKIIIKPNFVEHRQHSDYDNYADHTPAVIVALLKQLVVKAGVSQSSITVCDSSRYISDKIFYRCRSLFPDVVYTETNFYTEFNDINDIGKDPNRPPVEPTEKDMIFYSGVNIKDNNTPIPNDKLPKPYVEADYVINLAIPKPHGSAVVTLCAKNWYGCFCVKPGHNNSKNPHHDLSARRHPKYGQYRILVDLMGHEHLGGKTILFILESLWGFGEAHSSGSEPRKWQMACFDNDYPSSIFMSQDPVAIDSVGFDFLRAEFADKMEGAPDDYLHEAALAHNPPSGTFYDPHRPIGDANVQRLQSLGVHEHWDSPNTRRYTRNLGKGSGIELVSE